MGPIDYSGVFAQATPQDSLMGGMKNGIALQQMQIERQQMQAKLAQQAAMKADIDKEALTPTVAGTNRLMMKYPQLAEPYDKLAKSLAPEETRTRIESAMPIFQAMRGGKNDIAASLMREQAVAYKNSGREKEAAAAEAHAKQIEENPGAALLQMTGVLSAVIGPDKFAKMMGEQGQEERAAQLQPSALAEADTKAADAKIALTTKAIGVIAQKAGALSSVKGTKPAQVESMFKALAAQGVIPKAELSDYLASIPQDPAAIPEYLNTYKLAGMKPDDQMKFTTPTADASLSAKTQVQTTGMNNATSRANNRDDNATTLKVQDKIDARHAAAGSAEPTLPPEALSMMAQQYLAGDKTVMQNLGRGAQGSANIVALRAAITKEAVAKGMTGPQIAATIADYGGLSAGLRTSANISARVENAISEAKELAPLALAASQEVSRSGLLPFGKVGVMFDTQTNNPALKKFATANNGLVSAYAGAMARGQKPTVSDYDHAREILLTAQNHEAYAATVGQMFKEMEAASRAPQNVREHLRGEIGGGKPGGHAAPPAAGIPAGWSVTKVGH